MEKSMTEGIENYAISLVKHGCFPTIDEVRTESTRWHKKKMDLRNHFCVHLIPA